MKYLFSILLLTLFSCKNESNSSPKNSEKRTYNGQELEEIASAQITDFDNYLIKLYTESKNDQGSAIKKADSCLSTIKAGKNEWSMIENHVTNSLNYLKAELYYNLGNMILLCKF